MVIRGFGFWLLLLSTTLAQAPARVGTASISGKVLLDGKPAAEMLVILSKHEQVSPAQVTPPPRTTTDANGQYRFSGLSAGKYFVNVAAPGYINSKRQGEWEAGSSLSLADGETIENVDFALVKGGVITGRVMDEQGRPVIEEPLVLYRVEGNGNKMRAYCRTNTDDRGVYRCFTLLPGKYIVGAGKDDKKKDEAEGYYGARSPYARSWYPNATDEEGAKVIELSAGSEVAEIDLKLGRRKKGVRVLGRVIAADTNRPVARAYVGFSRVNEDGKTTGFSTSNDSMTNADGEFRILNLTPGKYRLTPMMMQGGDYYGEPLTVEVGTEDQSGLELKMQRGTTLTGVAVLEDPVNREATGKLARLMLFANATGGDGYLGPSSQSLIGSDGSFQLKGLRPGKMQIRLGNFETELRGFSITRLERDGAPVESGLEVKAGEAITGVRLVIGYGAGSIRGELKFENGGLPDGIGLHLKSRRNGVGESSNWIEVDARNRFAIEGLTTGTYELTVETHSTRPPWDKPAVKLTGIKKSVDVTNGQETKVTITVDLSGKGGSQ